MAWLALYLIVMVGLNSAAFGAVYLGAWILTRKLRAELKEEYARQP